jgi:hypothetical protein
VAFLALSSILAYAQTANVEIGFPFKAGGKDFAAGKYSVDRPQAGAIAIRGAGGSAVLLSLTRLALLDKGTEFKLVFDVVGDQPLLSEIWFGGEDGYLVLSTKEAHKHTVVGGSKK